MFTSPVFLHSIPSGRRNAPCSKKLGADRPALLRQTKPRRWVFCSVYFSSCLYSTPASQLLLGAVKPHRIRSEHPRPKNEHPLCNSAGKLNCIIFMGFGWRVFSLRICALFFSSDFLGIVSYVIIKARVKAYWVQRNNGLCWGRNVSYA